MKCYVLFRNNSSEYVDFDKTKKYKKGEVKAILLECYHPVFGFFYVAQDFKTFKKTMKYANKSTISYRFLDGTYVDNEDDQLFVKNKYWYYNASDLFSKIVEISINETIFNDFFWVYQSFYQYIYDDIKIKLKSSKKKKTLSGNQFYKKYIYNYKDIFSKDVIEINNNKWNNVSIKNASDICLVKLFNNIFFKVDSKIFKLGKYLITSKLYLVDDIVIENIDAPLLKKELTNKLNKPEGLFDLLMVYVSKYVIRKLERIDDQDVYLVECKIKFNNKKLNKKKYKFGKFVRKYFVDIQKY